MQPARDEGLGSAPALATVVPIDLHRRDRSAAAERSPMGWSAIAIAIALAVSPLASGYFDFTVWGPLALGAMVLLVIVVRVSRPVFTRLGVLAAAGLGALVALSAASILWAESKDSAWTSTNRVALYAAIFGIVLLAVRDRSTGRAIVMILGAGALIACVWLDCRFALGHGQDAFINQRLDAPIGYVNGTGALLVMASWPWLAYAEAAGRRWLRSAALAAAALMVSTCVLTQARAVVPAMVIASALALLCCEDRVRRALNLCIVAATVACSLPWTLAVYNGATALSAAPTQAHIQAAGIALLGAAIAAGLARQGLSLAVALLSEQRRAQLTRTLGATMLAGLALALVVGLAVGEPLIVREWHEFTALHVNQNVSSRFVDAGGYRYDLWRVAIREFVAHPLAGLGAGNYDAGYYLLRHNPEYVLQPHSLELQELAELGMLGFAALLVFCGPVLVAGLRRGGTLASEDRLIKVAALGMFTAWLVDTSVDWPYDIPGIAGIAFVAAALLLVPAVAGATVRKGRRGSSLWTIPALVVIALLAAGIGRQYAATRISQAGLAQVARTPAKAIKTLRRAAQFDPYSLNTLYGIASAYARLDDYVDARDALLVAAAREPRNYVPPTLLGDLAMRRGDDSLAAAEYRHAISLDPDDPSLTSSLAAALGAVK